MAVSTGRWWRSGLSAPTREKNLGKIPFPRILRQMWKQVEEENGLKKLFFWMPQPCLKRDWTPYAAVLLL